MAVSLVPASSEQERSSCPNCSATLAPDQRYCLSCGQPVSAVRLEFLDFLVPEQPAPGARAEQSLPPAYVTVIEPSAGPDGWLRRYSGLFGLLAVLLLAVTAGLLVGHWVTQNKNPGQQVIKVEGLSAAPAAAASTAATTPSSSSSGSQAAAAAKAPAAKTEAAEAKEAKAIEKAPPPKPVKVTATKLQKLGNTTGKKHEEEIAKLGNEPIETGG